MADNSSYLLYTGCVIRSRFPHVEKASRLVLERLGLELTDLQGATCCPEQMGMRSLDQETWLTLAARNLSLGKDDGRPLMTLCSGCYNTFQECRHTLAENSGLRDRVAQNLKSVGRGLDQVPDVEHFARFIYQEIGPDRLAGLVKRPLDGMKIAFHQGCHFDRPSDLLGFDDPDNPTKLEELVRALGAQVVDYPRKSLCCGLTLMGVDPDLSLRMGFEKLRAIKQAGAQAVVLICPSCLLQFDLNQKRMEKQFNTELGLPVLYLTELIALALGEPLESLGLSMHRVKVEPLLEQSADPDNTGSENRATA